MNKITRLFLFLFTLLMPISGAAVDWGAINLRDMGRDDAGQNWVALDIQLNAGWKTYWQYAGQNGLDPLVELKQDNKSIPLDIRWPPPKLFLADDLPAMGYDNAQILVPIAFQADGAATLDVEIGVCQTVCIPVSLSFDIDARPGYNFEQYILKNAPIAAQAPHCEWSRAALEALDPSRYWMFVTDEGLIAHEAPEEGFSEGAIYALDDQGVWPQDCG